MTIEQLEKRVAQLEQMVLQIAKGNVNTIGKVDDTSNRVTAITPYTETKTAYYGETEKTFYDVPDGNVSVYFTDYDGDYSVSRVSGRLTISFDALTEQTDITISIQ
ncbi:MAG: hypothetical protein IKE94_09645 [Aeriscardovia sp.]|nr:hypothetical protein [Aeriscardovia sp.]